jgi:hypothetical protein
VHTNNESLEDLDTIFITNRKLRVNTHSVTRLNVRAVQLHLICLFLENDSGHELGQFT